MMRALFIVYFLLIGLPAFAAAPVSCGRLYAQADGRAFLDDARIAKAKAALDRDMDDAAAAIARLEISADEIVPLEFLGAGFSGSVFRVKYQGKEYALKLFERSAFDKTELPSILMQKHLGDLGLAPKVAGVLDEAQSAKFFRTHADRLADGDLAKAEDARYGLLMELVEGVAHKRLDPKRMAVTAAEQERLLKDSDHMVSALHQLKIAPYDLDLMVTNDKRLMLIDLTPYLRGEFNLPPMQRQFQNITKGLLQSD